MVLRILDGVILISSFNFVNLNLINPEIRKKSLSIFLKPINETVYHEFLTYLSFINHDFYKKL